MDDVKINKQEWDQLNQGQRGSITNIINEFFKGSSIVPDPTASPSVGIGGVSGSLCEAACNLAQAAAEAACQSISDPIAKAVCLAAAKSAGDVCRSKCT